ncbi:hypothetical protein KL86DYS1_11395 [uncultured Dysgonomonas sp.]|uniref:Uncharacterized protein n=1 Tax=uncultured Dysgonomonas sp. TaxID=206096 RepID=A0A212J7N0_9BACT|nr:hypothetical protein KL86DYS1_11395 [uncultured Dysgonomonas sp.]
MVMKGFTGTGSAMGCSISQKPMNVLAIFQKKIECVRKSVTMYISFIYTTVYV